jgi:hypothetical protein
MISCVSCNWRDVLNDRFYTVLPPTPPTHRYERTFIVLPPRSARSYSHFSPALNRLAPDEINAHMGMFEAQSNDGFYELGLQTALLIRDTVMMGKGVVPDDDTKNAQERTAEWAMNNTLNTTAAEGSKPASQDLIQL